MLRRSIHKIIKRQAGSSSEGFLQGQSSPYVEQMYEAWKSDPKSVHVSWQAYFSNVGQPNAFQAPPTLLKMADHEGSPLPYMPNGTGEVLDHMKVQLLVRAYQVRGHHLAKLDPLGILQPDLSPTHPPELEPEYYGFTQADMDKKFHVGQGMLPNFKPVSDKMTLRQIIDQLRSTYCGSIGIEYTHIPDRQQCDWIREHFEVPRRFQYTKEQKAMILDRLIWSESFERFCSSKYPSVKRFGLEGCESLIPGMKSLIDRSVDLGIKNIVMGMPHRGRLNVLSNVVRKPMESIFCEFSGSLEPGIEGSGDVKYHLGMNYDRPTPSGKRIHLSLVANPSHLEAVDPVVQGKVAATQYYAGDKERNQSMAVLLHGDAAFAAQGVVYETFGFSDLPNYEIGGTVHIVVNNQIGFTTDPRFARSTPYCTDVAKVVQAPIIHVNGDDVESVVYACQLAADWRQKYKKDVVIDIVCYRRYGHNEIDQPAFTQPVMYKKIAQQTPVLEKYVAQLVQDGTFTQQEIDAMKSRVWGILEEAYEKSKGVKESRSDWVSTTWQGFMTVKELSGTVTPVYETGVKQDTLKKIGSVISEVPAGFNCHPVLNRILKARKKAINENEPVDWSTAEHMAIGSLLLEGKHVRLSGQDVERGTFSHRHAVLHDQENEQQYVALNHLGGDQAHYTVCNSSLSEFGTLGFELGYSLVSPHSLVLWEAQFGDFANNAQCIIDQFIASGEKKWLQRTGMALLLPHGYDGAGPEHSSCRIERFLQLCDDNATKFPDYKNCRQIQDSNMQVVYCSTPANYFHVLRRQLHRDFRKPLIVAVSKQLLRHPQAKSSMDEMASGTKFTRLYGEVNKDLKPNNKINKIIFCTGQVYYALARTREANKIDDTVICRVEQLNPFPYDLVVEQADKYPNAKDVVWAQEEPMNFGSWDFVDPRIETALKNSKNHNNVRARYAGRDPTGAVATGNKKMHEQQEVSLLSEALLGSSLKPVSFTSGVPIFKK